MKHGTILLLDCDNCSACRYGDGPPAQPLRIQLHHPRPCSAWTSAGAAIFPRGQLQVLLRHTLTVTPALLAKYFDTARKIARAAIEPVPPPAIPELERSSNTFASRGITWRTRLAIARPRLVLGLDGYRAGRTFRTESSPLL